MPGTVLRGVRGATTVSANDAGEILDATRELLEEMCQRNQVRPDDIASAIFTVTPDLNATFPAEAARQLGWKWVPMLCATEIPVPGRLTRCIRILIQVNTSKKPDEIKHVYLREAEALRPDWSSGAN